MKHTVKQGDVTLVYEGTPEEIATFIYYEENGIDIDMNELTPIQEYVPEGELHKVKMELEELKQMKKEWEDQIRLIRMQ